ncbi:RNA polymerase sigma factor [Euzebya sp.]|uniref:RNA polymerase sigma factor n=1 Tax=Euzebya sp. TaxID=1971409 RepID=UPI0035173B6D
MEETPDAVLAPLARPLVAAVTLYVGDRGVAEELAQEAMARALVDWSRVRARDRPEAWVYRVAFNLARSRWRRRGAERRAYARHGATGDASVDHGPQTTTAVVVREAVAALPPRYRQVVACRYLADLSVADTAVAMGCAEGTVKSLTYKALATLRDVGLEEVVLDA